MGTNLSDRADVNQDVNGQRLFSLINVYDPPGFVKDASSDDIAGTDLPDQAYADPVRRIYPIHTKAATWVSAAYLFDSCGSAAPEYLRNAIQKAAEYHGISSFVDELKKTVDEKKKTDHGLVKYAISCDLPDGTVFRALPIRNALELDAAQKYLQDNRTKMAFEDRQMIAENICKIAEELQFSVDPWIERQAGYGECTVSDVLSLLRERSVLARGRSKEASDLLRAAANVCEKNPENCRDRERRLKLASLIDIFDRSLGLVSIEGIRSIEDALFSIHRKEAAEVIDQHCVASNEAVYRIQDLSKVSVDTIRSHFGDDLAESISVGGGVLVSPTKFAETLATLPRPEMDLMENLLQEAGIRPLLKEGSDWRGTDDLRQAAVR